MSNLKSFMYAVVFSLITSSIVANPPDFNPRAGTLTEKNDVLVGLKK